MCAGDRNTVDGASLSSDEESDVCDFEDHPYSSPSEESDNDDVVVQMDFSVFSMENSVSTGQQSRTIESSNETCPNQDRRETVNQSLDWCKCGQCTACATKEAVCCHDRPEVLDFMDSEGGCITEETFFQVQLLSDEGLQYNRLIFASLIKDFVARKQFLDREFDNRLKRHLCYRNFLVFVNRGQPLGPNNRVVTPRCVVLKIRERYPDQNGQYIGFNDPAEII